MPDASRILLLNGHPDPRPERLCAALAAAYQAGAEESGYQVRRLDVGALEFNLISSAEDFAAEPSPAIRQIQEQLREADHLVIIHPLWLGGMPAKLKGLLEQVFRYGVAISPPGAAMHGLLKGKSARVIVTMGMPAPIFRWVFGAYGLKSLERGLLWISGVKPIEHTVIGSLGAASVSSVKRRLSQVERLGRQGR